MVHLSFHPANLYTLGKGRISIPKRKKEKKGKAKMEVTVFGFARGPHHGTNRALFSLISLIGWGRMLYEGSVFFAYAIRPSLAFPDKV